MARRKGKPPQPRHDSDFKVKVVKTSIEKSLSGTEAEKAFGVGKSTWWKWKRIYEDEGEEALRSSARGRKRAKKQLPPEAQEKLRSHVLEAKRDHPYFGVFRVWKVIRPTPVHLRQSVRSLRNIPARRRERWLALL